MILGPGVLQPSEFAKILAAMSTISSSIAHLPDRYVADGEIVIAGEAGLDFEALLLRIHPAARG